MKTLRILTRVKNITLKGTDQKKDICEYSYTPNGETWYQVKFKQECEKQPKTAGYYLVDVDETKDLSIQKMKAQEKFKPNDVLWIANVIDFKRDVDYEKELEAKRLEEIKNLFKD